MSNKNYTPSVLDLSGNVNDEISQITMRHLKNFCFSKEEKNLLRQIRLETSDRDTCAGGDRYSLILCNLSKSHAMVPKLFSALKNVILIVFAQFSSFKGLHHKIIFPKTEMILTLLGTVGISLCGTTAGARRKRPCRRSYS